MSRVQKLIYFKIFFKSLLHFLKIALLFLTFKEKRESIWWKVIDLICQLFLSPKVCPTSWVLSACYVLKSKLLMYKTPKLLPTELNCVESPRNILSYSDSFDSIPMEEKNIYLLYWKHCGKSQRITMRQITFHSPPVSRDQLILTYRILMIQISSFPLI